MLAAKNACLKIVAESYPETTTFETLSGEIENRGAKPFPFACALGLVHSPFLASCSFVIINVKNCSNSNCDLHISRFFEFTELIKNTKAISSVLDTGSCRYLFEAKPEG